MSYTLPGLAPPIVPSATTETPRDAGATAAPEAEQIYCADGFEPWAGHCCPRGLRWNAAHGICDRPPWCPSHSVLRSGECVPDDAQPPRRVGGIGASLGGRVPFTLWPGLNGPVAGSLEGRFFPSERFSLTVEVPIAPLIFNLTRGFIAVGANVIATYAAGLRNLHGLIGGGAGVHGLFSLSGPLAWFRIMGELGFEVLTDSGQFGIAALVRPAVEFYAHPSIPGPGGGMDIIVRLMGYFVQ